MESQGREALLAGQSLQSTAVLFRGVCESVSAVIHGFLELVCMDNLFLGLCINLKKVVLVLWNG